MWRQELVLELETGPTLYQTLGVGMLVRTRTFTPPPTGRMPAVSWPTPARTRSRLPCGSLQASLEEIRHAWRREALRHHPDRNRGDSERFQAVQASWEILRDAGLRAEYDKALLHRLYLQEYLQRFRDLILTSSGLGLPLEQDSCCCALPRHLEFTPEAALVV